MGGMGPRRPETRRHVRGPAARPDSGPSAPTIYRRVAAGYAGMANVGPRGKVGHGLRGRSAPRRAD